MERRFGGRQGLILPWSATIPLIRLVPTLIPTWIPHDRLKFSVNLVLFVSSVCDTSLVCWVFLSLYFFCPSCESLADRLGRYPLGVLCRIFIGISQVGSLGLVDGWVR